jgi:hypothetical protein
MRVAVLKRLSGDRLELRTPYDEDFVDDLKTTIPRSARHWDSDKKVWIVLAEYRESLLAVLEEYFRVVDTDSKGRASQDSEAHAILHLLPSAPPELVKVAYRCLALLVHPDKANGDLSQMQKLNAAYERLQKENYG